LKVVIKFGHSLVQYPLVPGNYESAGRLVKSLVSKHNKVVAVVGGGPQARQYIQTAKKLGCDNVFADMLGIGMTRLNARLLIGTLGEIAYPKPAEDVDQLKEAFDNYDVVCTGGFTPGHSTDAVAAIAAETVKANLFVKSMEVDGIYDSDPNKNPRAKLLKEITFDKLFDLIVATGKSEAGEYRPLDLVAFEILRRASVQLVFVGPRFQDIAEVISGKKIGTWVKRS